MSRYMEPELHAHQNRQVVVVDILMLKFQTKIGLVMLKC